MGLDAIKKVEESLNNPRQLFLFYIKESVRACIRSDKDALIYLLNNLQSFFDKRSCELDKTYFTIFDKSVFSFINYNVNLITDYNRNIGVFIPQDLLPEDMIRAIQEEMNEIEKTLINQRNNSSFDEGFDLFAKDEFELENELIEKKQILFGRGLNCRFTNFNNSHFTNIKEFTDYVNLEKVEFEIEIKVPKHRLNADLPFTLIAQLGKTLSRHALCTWTEDYVDEDNGEVLSIERKEIVVEKESVLTTVDLINIYEKTRKIWIYNDDLVAHFNYLMSCLDELGTDVFIEKYFNELDFRDERDRQIIERLFFELIVAGRSAEFEIILKYFYANPKESNLGIVYAEDYLKLPIIYWINYLMKEFKDETVQFIIEMLHQYFKKDNPNEFNGYLYKIAYIFINCYFDSGLLMLSDKYGLSQSDIAELNFIYMINENDYRYIDEYVFNIN